MWLWLQIGLQCLVEVHSVAEMGRVLRLDLSNAMLGINNRNLETFKVMGVCCMHASVMHAWRWAGVMEVFLTSLTAWLVSGGLAVISSRFDTVYMGTPTALGFSWIWRHRPFSCRPSPVKDFYGTYVHVTMTFTADVVPQSASPVCWLRVAL